jgi:hypothetical protein
MMRQTIANLMTTLRQTLSLIIICALLTVQFSTAANARFISPDDFDPTLPGVGTNRYAYSGNDPVNKSDPNGHIWGFVAAAFTAFFGGTTYANTPKDDNDVKSETPGQQIGNMAGSALAGRTLSGAAKKGWDTATKKKDKKEEAKATDEAEQAATVGTDEPTDTNPNSKLEAGVNASGKFYSKTVTVNGKTYTVQGVMSVNGKSVTLDNLDIAQVGSKSPPAAGAFNAVKSEIAKDFRTMGFDNATVNGTRISGANPGRLISIDIDLTRY